MQGCCCITAWQPLHVPVMLPQLMLHRFASSNCKARLKQGGRSLGCAHCHLLLGCRSASRQCQGSPGGFNHQVLWVTQLQTAIPGAAGHHAICTHGAYHAAVCCAFACRVSTGTVAQTSEFEGPRCCCAIRCCCMCKRHSKSTCATSAAMLVQVAASCLAAVLGYATSARSDFLQLQALQLTAAMAKLPQVESPPG